MKWLRFCFLIVNVVLSCVPTFAKQPNVVIVMTDDQGYPEVSAHGNPVLQTPNLDALHKQSLRLTDFHVAPMCAPTRGQLLSGVQSKYSAELHLKSSSRFAVCAILAFQPVDFASVARDAVSFFGVEYPEVP